VCILMPIANNKGLIGYHQNELGPGSRPLVRIMETCDRMTKCKLRESDNEIDRHCEEFFETYQDMPFRSEPNEEFLDTRDDLEMYEKVSKRDLMDLVSIYCILNVIYCTAPFDVTASTELDHVCERLAPTDKLSKLLTEDDWLFVFTAKSTFGSSAPIIFDTGASLAVSPERGDSMNGLTPLHRPTTLGGMANDLDIKGIWTVV
jgi:hypothetical protein